MTKYTDNGLHLAGRDEIGFYLLIFWMNSKPMHIVMKNVGEAATNLD